MPVRINVLVVLGFVALQACSLEPLRSEDLFGTPPQVSVDAAPIVDAPVPVDTALAVDALAPVDTALAVNTPPVECMSASRTGILTGIIIDKCSGLAIAANIGIFNRHSCSFGSGKGSYCFEKLPVGCDLTLIVAKDGYVTDSRRIMIDPSGTANVRIELVRASPIGCAGPNPGMPFVCTCEGPACVMCF